MTGMADVSGGLGGPEVLRRLRQLSLYAPPEAFSLTAESGKVRLHLPVLRKNLGSVTPHASPHDTGVRPHRALGYRPPAPAARAFPTLTPQPRPVLALGAGLN
jgi:hypothetical protein